jgi:hypothetical protein
MIWSYCPLDRQDDRVLGVILRILRPYSNLQGHPETGRMTGFMVDPPCLVTLGAD